MREPRLSNVTGLRYSNTAGGEHCYPGFTVDDPHTVLGLGQSLDTTGEQCWETPLGNCPRTPLTALNCYGTHPGIITSLFKKQEQQKDLTVMGNTCDYIKIENIFSISDIPQVESQGWPLKGEVKGQMRLLEYTALGHCRRHCREGSCDIHIHTHNINHVECISSWINMYLQICNHTHTINHGYHCRTDNKTTILIFSTKFSSITILLSFNINLGRNLCHYPS